ncbi:hypothetical protein SK128_024866 [Halocaridina rubra]|uniref:Isoprenoid synthase domain-containing protein n=1 Tax=Halocaridina rubra TaxID=373956 RepID=A0AAN8XE07_HALRR
MGRPLIVYTLKSLAVVPWISKIVVPSDEVPKMREVVHKAGLKKIVVIKGDETRHRSIKRGIEALASEAPDVVIIHDGARPLVPQDILTKVVKAAYAYRAAGAVRNLVSTVLKPTPEMLLMETLKRSLLVNSEMPQAFTYEIISEAYKKATPDELGYGTECLDLALKHSGVQAKLIPGPEELWKVTNSLDLEVANLTLPKYFRNILFVVPSVQSSASLEPLMEANDQLPSPKRLGMVEKDGEKDSHASLQVPDVSPLQVPVYPSLLKNYSSPTLPLESSASPSVVAPQLPPPLSPNIAAPPSPTVPRKSTHQEQNLQFLTSSSEEEENHTRDTGMLLFGLLRDTLREKSNVITLTKDKNQVKNTPFCTVIVTGYIVNLSDFEKQISLCRALSTEIRTLIFILTLDVHFDAIKMTDIQKCQKLIKDSTGTRKTRVSVILNPSSRGNQDVISFVTSCLDMKKETSSSTKALYENETKTLEIKSKVFSEEKVASTDKHPETPNQEDCGNIVMEISKKRKIMKHEYSENDSELTDIISAILDESSMCFHGKVILLDK